MRPVESYISNFEEQKQVRLNQLRSLIIEMVPEIKESVSYKMPTYKNNKYVLYFGGYQNHIGFYPIGRNTELEDELVPYRAKNAKDTLHFPYNMPLPKDLIKKIVTLYLL
ncbi:iron chaperone [Pedobacter sp.]|uniref:iron chaperone n=1 Tax=Pedobacter sp. TaxID=1411316 RepID=UPI003BA9F91F